MSLQAEAIGAFVFAAVLASGGWAYGERRYHAGEARIQAAWDAEKVAQQEAALKAEQAHRDTEQALQSNFHEVQNAYEYKIARDNVLIAGNGAALDGLRARLAASASHGQLLQDPAGRSSADGEAAQLRSDIERCASEYQQLGTEAAGYSEKLEALQAIAGKLPQVLNGEQP